MVLKLSMTKFGDITFRIESENSHLEHILESGKASEVRDTLSSMLNYIDHWEWIIRRYKKWEDPKSRVEQIKQELDDDEKNWYDERKEYSIGNNFAGFTGDSFGTYKECQFADNHEAGNKLEKIYTEKFGENTLIFDTEASYCYVYTESREEAERFLEWSYTEIIEPVIKNVLEES